MGTRPKPEARILFEVTVLLSQPVARGHLEDQEESGMVILRGFGKYVVKMGETEMTRMAHLVGQLEVFFQLLLLLELP
jgi:hypothetical protein